MKRFFIIFTSVGLGHLSLDTLLVLPPPFGRSGETGFPDSSNCYTDNTDLGVAGLPPLQGELKEYRTIGR